MCANSLTTKDETIQNGSKNIGNRTPDPVKTRPGYRQVDDDHQLVEVTEIA